MNRGCSCHVREQYSRQGILFPILDFVVECCQLSISEFAFQSGFLQLLNVRDLLIPLCFRNQAIALAAFQSIIDPIILLKDRFAVGFFFLFFVSAYLAAGAFCFAGGNFVAIECVIGSDGKEIFFAVSALAWQVACCHSFEEIYIEKADQFLKMHSLRQNDFALGGAVRFIGKLYGKMELQRCCIGQVIVNFVLTYEGFGYHPSERTVCFRVFLRAAMYKEVNVLNGTDEEVLRELRYQGNNLNQLTVMARQGRIQLVNFEPFVEVYEKVWQALNSSASRVV